MMSLDTAANLAQVVSLLPLFGASWVLWKRGFFWLKQPGIRYSPTTTEHGLPTHLDIVNHRPHPMQVVKVRLCALESEAGGQVVSGLPCTIVAGHRARLAIAWGAGVEVKGVRECEVCVEEGTGKEWCVAPGPHGSDRAKG